MNQTRDDSIAIDRPGTSPVRSPIGPISTCIVLIPCYCCGGIAKQQSNCCGVVVDNEALAEYWFKRCIDYRCGGPAAIVGDSGRKTEIFPITGPISPHR